MVDTSGETHQNSGAFLVDSPGAPLARDGGGIVGDGFPDELGRGWLEQLLQVGIPSTYIEESDKGHGALSEMEATHPKERCASPVYRTGVPLGNCVLRQMLGAQPYNSMPNAMIPHQSQSLEVQVFTSNIAGKKKVEGSASELKCTSEGNPKMVTPPVSDNIQGISQQCVLAISPLVQPPVAPRRSVTSASGCRLAEPEAIEKRSDVIPRWSGSETLNKTPDVPSNQHIDRNEMVARAQVVVAEGTPDGFEFQTRREGKKEATVEADQPTKGSSSLQGDVSPALPQFENEIDAKGPAALAALHSRTSSPGSFQQSSHFAPALQKRSQLRSIGDYGRDFEPRTIGTSEALTAVQNSSRGVVSGQVPDAAVRDLQERATQSSSERMAQSNGALDFPLKQSGQQWSHARAHVAEAGFQDPSLGWISVRATRDLAGLHALVVSPSPEAERTLSAHLSGLNSYLANNQIEVSAVGLSSCEDARHSSNRGAESQQHNAREEGREQEEKHRPATVERIDSTVASPMMRSTETSHRHEFPWARSGASGLRNSHISLVA